MTITQVWQRFKWRQENGKELQLKTNKQKTVSGTVRSRTVCLRSWNQVNWNEVSSVMSRHILLPLVGSKLEVPERIGDVGSQWPVLDHCRSIATKMCFSGLFPTELSSLEVFCSIWYWPSFVYSISQNNQYNLVINEMWENHFTHMCFMKL